MLNVAEISSLTPAVAPAINHNDPKAIGREFDAMLLELLLRQSGVFRAMDGDESAEPTLMSEMFLQDFARQLAAQVDLGFGSLLLNQIPSIEGRE